MQEMQDTQVSQDDPLEEGMATHSTNLAWRIPWTEEPDGLQSLGLQSQIQLSEHMHSSYILNSRKRIPLRQTWWSFSSPFPHRLLSELLPAVVMEAAGLPLARTNFLLHWTKQA